MSKQWKAATRGGHDYKITISDPNSGRPIRGEVDDSGLVVEVHWTETGRCLAEGEHPYDLIPIEQEASPAKVRVDLALAAYSLREAVVEFRRAEDAKDNAGKAMFDVFEAAGMLDVVVKIDGDYYHFFVSEFTARFRKIEVL